MGMSIKKLHGFLPKQDNYGEIQAPENYIIKISCIPTDKHSIGIVYRQQIF